MLPLSLLEGANRPFMYNPKQNNRLKMLSAEIISPKQSNTAPRSINPKAEPALSRSNVAKYRCTPLACAQCVFKRGRENKRREWVHQYNMTLLDSIILVQPLINTLYTGTLPLGVTGPLNVLPGTVNCNTASSNPKPARIRQARAVGEGHMARAAGRPPDTICWMLAVSDPWLMVSVYHLYA